MAILKYYPKFHIIIKVLIEDRLKVNHLGWNILFIHYITHIIDQFNHICSTIKRYPMNKEKDTELKFYKFMAVSILMYGAEFRILN